jgi:hypothetical protein
MVRSSLPAAQPSPRWHDAVRCVTTALWVSALTLWAFYQMNFLVAANVWQRGVLVPYSAALRIAPPLFLACFLAALTFGLAWYVFSHRLYRAQTGPVTVMQRRLAIAQAHMVLCTSCCVVLLNFRVLDIGLFVNTGSIYAADWVHQLYWGPGHWVTDDWPVEMAARVWAVAAALVFLQGWQALPILGGRRRVFAALAVILLLVGWGGARFGADRLVPWELDDPELRRMLAAGPGEPTAREFSRRHFTTHDGDGNEVPLVRLQRWIYEYDEKERCEICLLPPGGGPGLIGLPVRLSREPPSSGAPTVVLEIPRGGHEIRVYRTGEARSWRVVKRDGWSSLNLDVDRAVLKVDVAVRMSRVVEILERIRSAGIQEVLLAVIPIGTGSPGISPPAVLETTGGKAVPIYRPESWRELILVRRYRDAPVIRAECPESDWYDVIGEDGLWRIPDPGTVPGEVGIELSPDADYADFILLFNRVIAGGARVVHLQKGLVCYPQNPFGDPERAEDCLEP